jgi:D-beta-D-heptose 7-phosphate kinase/D-beta-D-heptose 1-phosphate adenosyltransferase
MQTIVLITGGFDPIHSGHIAYINAARELGDQLIVGVNTDSWLERKKGRAFMTWSERAAIVGNLKSVDEVLEFDDFDGSARDAIRRVRAKYPTARIIFGNGGDRTSTNIPEMDIQDANLEFRFGVGGNNKANSSSWILEDWKAPKTRRPWGYYRVLYEQGTGTKVKELVVEPGQRLSMQRHEHRAEIWYVAQGVASIFTLDEDNESTFLAKCREHNSITIHQGDWHQLTNAGDVPLKIVEIQFGSRCQEDDIERREP